METNNINTEFTEAVVVSTTPLPKKYDYVVSATELLSMKEDFIPYLWENLIPQQGIAVLSGSSDMGKSAFLRFLSMAVASKKSEFLDQKLNVRYGRVIYFSTEDGKSATNYLLRKQMDDETKKEDLAGLNYIFNYNNAHKAIEQQLKEAKTDLVIIDSFSDVFNGSTNDIIQVRKFMNSYSVLSEEYDCAIIFLHHNGKRTELLPASKNNLIGSQGIEGKARIVLELRNDGGQADVRQLYIVKGNYLSQEQKRKPMILKFNDHMQFSFVEWASVFGAVVQGRNERTYDKERQEKLMNLIMPLKQEGLSIDKIREKLIEDGVEKVPSKGTIQKWLKEMPGSQNVQSVST